MRCERVVVGEQPRDGAVLLVCETLPRSTRLESALRTRMQLVRACLGGTERRDLFTRKSSEGVFGDTGMQLKFDPVTSCFRAVRDLLPYQSVKTLSNQLPLPKRGAQRSAEILSKWQPRAARPSKRRSAPEESVDKSNFPLRFDLAPSSRYKRR